MTNRFQDADEEDALQNGILKDGHHLTCHMFAKDGAPLPGFTDVQRAIAATHDAITFDASLHKPGPRYATGTYDTAAHDAAITARNAAYEEYQATITDAWRSKSAPSGSYPAANGANVGDNCTINGSPGTLRAIPGHDGWLQCVADTNDSRPDTQQIKDSAYSEYDLQIQNSWRTAS
jgi:hypothetical protein